MKLHVLAALAALGVALSGCATIIKGTTQSISVETDPVTGAECKLVSSEGTWYVTTPGSVTVHKTKNDIEATCTKAGYQEAKATFPSHFNGATAGNLILGGVIGLGVDAASGANYQYPAANHVPMHAIGEPAEAPATTEPAATPAPPGQPTS